MKVKNRISSTDLFFVIVQTMLGIALLSLPYDIYQSAEKDGWISLIIASIFIQCIVLLFWLLCNRFPNLTLFDFSKVIVGKVTGTVINMFYIIYFLMTVCYIFIVFVDTVKRWVLPETPAWILLFIGAILLVYGSAGSVKHIVSLFSFFFLFIFFLFLISLFVFRDPTLDVRYLLPVGSSGWRNILSGTRDSYLSFIGFETFLIYFAFIQQSKQKSALRSALFAVLFVTFILLYIVILSTIMLSPEEMKMTPIPVLYILSALGVHLLSRLDLLFLSIWGPVVLMTVISFSFAGGMGINKVFQLPHKIAVSLFGTCVFILSTIFYYKEISFLETWSEKFFLVFGIVIPVSLLLLALLFRKKVDSANENS